MKEETPTTHPTLKVGQRFRLHPDCKCSSVFEVIRVMTCSATVRALGQQHVVIPGDYPDSPPLADFWKAGRALNISPQSSVITLPDPEDDPEEV